MNRIDQHTTGWISFSLMFDFRLGCAIILCSGVLFSAQLGLNVVIKSIPHNVREHYIGGLGGDSYIWRLLCHLMLWAFVAVREQAGKSAVVYTGAVS